MSRVGKGDLRGFDDEATKALLEAQERGARIKITRRGHALVFGPNGNSACVPPNMRMGNRSSQNSRAALARLWKEDSIP